VSKFTLPLKTGHSSDGQQPGKSARQEDCAHAGEVHDHIQENRKDAILN